MSGSPLPSALPGEHRVVDVAQDAPGRRRLAELGIRPGAEIRILRKTAGGGFLLDADGARVAVDRGTAACVLLEDR